ncbi:hypothetical protein [Longimicrobium sp.]|jgi:hypothetical protein|uniref:hypothetical protein n=1 Tax=Longimicrobium sp. TaxID=2029185 RepID=UPI002F9352E9
MRNFTVTKDHAELLRRLADHTTRLGEEYGLAGEADDVREARELADEIEAAILRDAGKGAQ